MEVGCRILIGLQIILGWLLQPMYWYQSRKQKKSIAKIENPLLKMSATLLARKIRMGEITSTEVVTAYIKRAKEVNPVINAVVEDRFAEALLDAKAIDNYLSKTVESQQEIESTKPLLGVPLTVKESCSLKGLSCSVGSKKRIGLKASDDSEAVRRLKEAGAIPLLVSNIPEMCSGWESNNLVTGKTCNPYNTNLSSGGSSGGEGALIASGASVIGIGSDVAGSIRVPAMFNGIFGHKPTPRIIPIQGHYPSSSDEQISEFLVVGPMTRYAEDLKLMVKIMAKEHVAVLKIDKEVDINKVNVYFMDAAEKSLVQSAVESEIKLVIQKCIVHLRDRCNATVIDFKFNMKNTCEMSASLFYNLQDIPNILQDPVNHHSKDNLYVEIAKRIFGKSQYSLHGLFFHLLEKTSIFVPKNKYKHYQAKAEALKAEFVNKLGNNGIFLYPTFPCPAFEHNKIFVRTVGVMYTMVFNVLGFPSTHVPLGKNSKGLPIGIQVIAAPYQDRLCLAIAEELEKCFGGWVEP